MKTWKKRVCALCLLFGCALCFPIGAAEETESGAYLMDLTVQDGYTVTALNADGEEVPAITFDPDGDGTANTGYRDAEKLELEFTGRSGYQYVVFLLSDGAEVPTESSIRYIDQKSGASAMDFTLYPDQMQKAGAYTVCVADNDSYKQVASFTVERFTSSLGDADGDGAITVLDAVAILQYCANMTPNNFCENAADTSKNGSIGVEDAVRILQYCADLIGEF